MKLQCTLNDEHRNERILFGNINLKSPTLKLETIEIKIFYSNLL